MTSDKGPMSMGDQGDDHVRFITRVEGDATPGRQWVSTPRARN